MHFLRQFFYAIHLRYAILFSVIILPMVFLIALMAIKTTEAHFYNAQLLKTKENLTTLFKHNDSDFLQNFLCSDANTSSFLRVISPIPSSFIHDKSDQIYFDSMQNLPQDFSGIWYDKINKIKWCVDLRSEQNSYMQLAIYDKFMADKVAKIHYTIIAIAIGFLLFIFLAYCITCYFFFSLPEQKINLQLNSIILKNDSDNQILTIYPFNKTCSTINSLLEKKQELFITMRNSLDNVAHDLRTPMTRLRSAIENAIMSQNSENYLDALIDSLESSDQVIKLLNTLMEVAEMETGALKLNLQKVDLIKIIRKIAEVYDLVAEDAKIRILLDLPNELFIHADSTRLNQLFGNLIDNAIKYSHPNSSIWISGEVINDHIAIKIQDHGIGITPAEIPKIFHRLYRSDSSRSQRGLGLGLSMVKAIVQAHHGEIKVTSKLNHGSTFTVVLPINTL